MNNQSNIAQILLFIAVFVGSCKSDIVDLDNCDCGQMSLVVDKRSFQIFNRTNIETLRSKLVNLNPINDDGRVIFGDTVLFNCINKQQLMILINEDYIKINDIKYGPEKSISRILRNFEAADYVKVKIKEALINRESIKELSLRNCNLKSIPKEVFELKNLEYLDLSLNLIEELPSGISKLSRLKELSLSYNLLNTVSPEIHKLGAIEKIWFLDNSLKELPIEICQLNNLKEINVRGNPIDKLPGCIPHMKSIKNFCFGTFEEKGLSDDILEQLEEFKIANKELNIQI